MSVGEERKEPEDQDVEDVLDEELDTPVIRLRRRLGSLKDVVAKHGPPKPRPKLKRSDSSPSVMDDDYQKKVVAPRNAKVEELDTALLLLSDALSNNIMYFKEKSDPNRLSVEDLKKQAGEDKKVVDPVKAVVALDLTLQKVNQLTATIKEQNAEHRRKVTATNAVDTLKMVAVAPTYKGKNKLKATGEKEFNKNIKEPTEAFIKQVEGPVKAGTPLTEDQHNRLVGLQGVLDKSQKTYQEKLDGIDQGKHPHEHTLYSDYVNVCSTLTNQLLSIQSNNVPTDLTAFRAKKRELLGSFAKFEKRCNLWKRIDSDEYDDQTEVLKKFQSACEDVCDDVNDKSTAKELQDATSKLDDVNSHVLKAFVQMFESQDSNGKLNDAVGKLGGKAKSSADVDFVKEAFKARFNVDVFEGDLTKTNVIAMYNVFNMVPDSHTKTNKWLTEVTRKLSLSQCESEYESSDNAPKPNGKIAMRALRTSGPLTIAQNKIFAPKLTTEKNGKKVKEKLDQFTWVTLHEIGHAVDESEGFMEDGANMKLFGDWKEESHDAIKGLVRAELRKEFSTYPKAFLDAFVKKVFDKEDMASSDVRNALLVDWKSNLTEAAGRPKDKKDLLDDPGVKAAEQQRQGYEDDEWPALVDISTADRQIKLTGTSKKLARDLIYKVLMDRVPLADAVDALYKAPDADSKPDWSGLTKAKAFSWYKGICYKDTSGFFKTVVHLLVGTDCWVKSEQMPINGRIYHEAYDGRWVSYSKASRDKFGITDYQFRAPGEFFAECYAAFMLKKLPKSAVSDKFDALESKDELRNRPTKSNPGG